MKFSKKNHPCLFTIFLLLFFASIANAQHQHMDMDMKAGNKNVYIAMMDTMMQNMDTVSMKHSADLDFMQMMIPHHQGAIEMAHYEIKHGKNFEMIQLAKSIIAEQTNEIQQMHLWLQNNNTKSMKENNDHEKPLLLTMSVMMENMPASHSLTGIDKSFAAIMMPHHQAGINMAKVILQFGASKTVSRLAQNIISSQEVEIEQMKSFINQ